MDVRQQADRALQELGPRRHVGLRCGLCHTGHLYFKAPPLLISAMVETVPVFAPMVRVTGTGFAVPLRLAFWAAAVKT